MRRLSSGNGLTPMISSCRTVQIQKMTPKGADDQVRQTRLNRVWNTLPSLYLQKTTAISASFFTITDNWYRASIKDWTQTEGIGFFPPAGEEVQSPLSIWTWTLYTFPKEGPVKNEKDGDQP